MSDPADLSNLRDIVVPPEVALHGRRLRAGGSYWAALSPWR